MSQGDQPAVTSLTGTPQAGPAPTQTILNLAWGMWSSAVVRAAAQLGVADAVGEQPADVREVARAVSADPGALGRLMRSLAAFGIFRQTAPGHYAHTESSRALRSDAPSAVRDIVLTGGNWGWATWGSLAESIRTGQTAFERLYGKDLFSYLDSGVEPGASTLIYNGYRAQARHMDPAVAAAMDLAGARTVVDVGGGSGSLLRAVLEHHPAVSGVLFDRAPTLAEVDPALRDGGHLAGRCRLQAGDCFAGVPAADVYVYRQVLHMWDDETCVAALGVCAATAPEGARVIVVEQLVSDPPENSYDPLMDLHMLLVTGGRERSAGEYQQIFGRAGLKATGVTPTPTPLRLLEAVVPPR
jgi:C-methyltransferase